MPDTVFDKAKIHQGSERPLINYPSELFLVYFFDEEMKEPVLELCRFNWHGDEQYPDGFFEVFTDELHMWIHLENKPIYWWRPFSFQHIESLFILTKPGA